MEEPPDLKPEIKLESQMHSSESDGNESSFADSHEGNGHVSSASFPKSNPSLPTESCQLEPTNCQTLPFLEVKIKQEIAEDENQLEGLQENSSHFSSTTCLNNSTIIPLESIDLKVSVPMTLLSASDLLPLDHKIKEEVREDEDQLSDPLEIETNSSALMTTLSDSQDMLHSEYEIKEEVTESENQQKARRKARRINVPRVKKKSTLMKLADDRMRKRISRALEDKDKKKKKKRDRARYESSREAKIAASKAAQKRRLADPAKRLAHNVRNKVAQQRRLSNPEQKALHQSRNSAAQRARSSQPDPTNRLAYNLRSKTDQQGRLSILEREEGVTPSQ